MTRLVRAGEGLVLGAATGVRDRFLVDSTGSGGRLAVVEHLLAPHAIAAPMHRHTLEDEFSLILEGRVWFVAAGKEHVAEFGDFVFKPRGEWHTLLRRRRRAGADARADLALGLEEAFQIIGTATEDVDLGPLIARFGGDADPEATAALVDKYTLTFGWRRVGARGGETANGAGLSHCDASAHAVRLRPSVRGGPRPGSG